MYGDMSEGKHLTMASTASSRRNSNAASTGGSRRGSVDSDGGFPFAAKLKKTKAVSNVKIVFMGKSMVQLLVLHFTLEMQYMICRS